MHLRDMDLWTVTRFRAVRCEFAAPPHPTGRTASSELVRFPAAFAAWGAKPDGAPAAVAQPPQR